MKYVNYITKDDLFRPEELGIFAIPSAMVGVVAMGVIIPAAYAMDGGRLLRLRYHQRQRRQKGERILKSVVISLGHPENEWIIINNL